MSGRTTVKRARNTQSQRGLGAFGVLVVIILIVVLAIVGMRLLPAYLEFFSVKKTLNAMQTSGEIEGSPASIRSAFDRRASIDDITRVTGQDLDIGKEEGKTVVSANYQVTLPLVANISLLVDFAASSTGQ